MPSPAFSISLPAPCTVLQPANKQRVDKSTRQQISFLTVLIFYSCIFQFLKQQTGEQTLLPPARSPLFRFKSYAKNCANDIGINPNSVFEMTCTLRGMNREKHLNIATRHSILNCSKVFRYVKSGLSCLYL
jgi:hypothetical protein